MTTKATPVVIGIKPEAGTAWHALSEAIDRMAEEGRRPACHADPDAWFSVDCEDQAEAAEACGWCPLAPLCLMFAMLNDERHGVWSGYNLADPKARKQAEQDVEGKA